MVLLHEFGSSRLCRPLKKCSCKPYSACFRSDQIQSHNNSALVMVNYGCISGMLELPVGFLGVSVMYLGLAVVTKRHGKMSGIHYVHWIRLQLQVLDDKCCLEYMFQLQVPLHWSYLVEHDTCYWLVPDFRGQLLGTDPNFGWYWHFCGTIINICTDRNPYKRGTYHHLRQRHGAMGGFYFKSHHLWRVLGTEKSIKIEFFVK